MKYAQRALRCKFMSALLYLGVLGTVVPSVTVIPTSFPPPSFRHGGPGALAAELSLDVRRMWLRNCGRDDRLVADRGREVIDVSVIRIRVDGDGSDDYDARETPNVAHAFPPCPGPPSVPRRRPYGPAVGPSAALHRGPQASSGPRGQADPEASAREVR